ncbi:hypothetical protein V2A60_002075 [Cordyceps javanica]
MEVTLDCHDYMLYAYYDDSEFDFECPTFGSPFNYMSAVLQHAERRSYETKNGK